MNAKTLRLHPLHDRIKADFIARVVVIGSPASNRSLIHSDLIGYSVGERSRFLTDIRFFHYFLKILLGKVTRARREAIRGVPTPTGGGGIGRLGPFHKVAKF